MFRLGKCASLLKRVTISVLSTLSLVLLGSSLSHAGTFEMLPGYPQGGEFVPTSGSNIPYVTLADGSYGIGTASGIASNGSLNGTITTKFVWKPRQIHSDPSNPSSPLIDDPNDPAPPKAVIKEISSISWGGMGFFLPPFGDADNGLEETNAYSKTTNSNFISSAVGSSTTQWSRVLTVTNGEVTIACEPTGFVMGGMQNYISFHYTVFVAPQYVSSTNCQSALRMPLGVGGTVNDTTYKATINGNDLVGATPAKKVKYQSTHEADDSTISIVMSVKNTDNVEFKTNDVYVVCNKYAIQNVSSFETGSSGLDMIPIITGHFSGMKHTPTNGADEYDESIFLEKLRNATAFHTGTHGFITGFGPTSSIQHIDGNDLVATIGKRPSWLPALNIVFTASCSTGAGTPPTNMGFTDIQTSSSYANRAYVGFDAVGFIKGLQQASGVFWAELKGFMGNPPRTLEEARAVAHSTYKQLEKHYNTAFNNNANANCVKIGDPLAKLNALYDRGQNTLFDDWYEIIN